MKTLALFMTGFVAGCLVTAVFATIALIVGAH